MEYVEAPADFVGAPRPAVFLAGGITGCPGWQEEVTAALADLPGTVLNPRRVKWPDDPAEIEAQIRWEHRHLRAADAVLFWFPAETLCPIALYELGALAVYRDERGPRPLFAGTHPQYQRRLDVTVQLKLARPEVAVRERVEEVVADLRGWVAAQYPR